jgi:hypothetical protein
MRKQPEKPATIVTPTENEDDWISALTNIDMFLQKKPGGPKTKAEAVALLCRMLRDREAECTLDVRGYIAELFERVELSRPPYRQKIPVYAISDTNLDWVIACGNFGKYIQRMPRDAALDKAAKEINRTKDQLEDVLNGKLGSFNRARKR